MTINYSFDESDLLSWYRYYYRSAAYASHRRTRYIASWTGIYFGVAIVASLCFQTWPTTAAAVMIATVLSATTRFSYDRQMESALKEQAAASRSNNNYGPHQLTITDDYLQEVTPVTDTRIKWRGITTVAVDDGHIFVVVMDRSALVVSNKSYAGSVPFADLPSVIEEQWRRKSATS